jgi:coatomer protein complex subunit epsilon
VNSKAVVEGTDSKAPTALQAVKQLAMFRQAKDPEARELVVDTVAEWLKDDMLCNDKTLQLIAAQIHVEDSDHSAALGVLLKMLHSDSADLEALALSVQCFLAMDRVDLAQRQLELMTTADDDDCLTQLAGAWVQIASGAEEAVAQATFTLEELLDKFGDSVPVFNLLAVCKMHQKQFPDAAEKLKRALNAAKKAKQVVPAETLINLMTVFHHMNQNPAVIEKLRADLVAKYPTHPWLARQAGVEEQFDSALKSIS